MRVLEANASSAYRKLNFLKLPERRLPRPLIPGVVCPVTAWGIDSLFQLSCDLLLHGGGSQVLACFNRRLIVVEDRGQS